jgi:hypothetical protein
MKVIFLDFDGVLNSKQNFLMTAKVKIKGASSPDAADYLAMKRDTNANNMFVLKYILEQVPDLRIVISSAWRLHYRLDQIADLFQYYKIDDSRMIGKTPKKFSSERMHEIHMWLDDQKEKGIEVDWVALDDHPIFMLEDPDKAREFLTDPWTGVTMQDAFKIIKHFNPNYHQPIMMI